MELETLSFSPENETLVSGGEDGTIRFWDTSLNNTVLVFLVIGKM